MSMLIPALIAGGSGLLGALTAKSASDQQLAMQKQALALQQQQQNLINKNYDMWSPIAASYSSLLKEIQRGNVSGTAFFRNAFDSGKRALAQGVKNTAKTYSNMGIDASGAIAENYQKSAEGLGSNLTSALVEQAMSGGQFATGQVNGLLSANMQNNAMMSNTLNAMGQTKSAFMNSLSSLFGATAGAGLNYIQAGANNKQSLDYLKQLQNLFGKGGAAK